jgi:hypothetical protein
MGKIVKYCSSCDEGFAEKFGFCPDCGAPLQAFEMNPVETPKQPIAAAPTPVEQPIAAAPTPIEQPIAAAPTPIEQPITAAPTPVEQPIDATPTSVPEVSETRFGETEVQEADVTPIEVEGAAASFDEVEDEPEAFVDDVDEEYYSDDTNEVNDTASGLMYVTGAGLTGLIDLERIGSLVGNRVNTPNSSAPARPAFVGGSNFLGLSDESARANSSYRYQAKYARCSKLCVRESDELGLLTSGRRWLLRHSCTGQESQTAKSAAPRCNGSRDRRRVHGLGHFALPEGSRRRCDRW